MNDRPIRVPPAGRAVWQHFGELSGQRTGNGFGPDALQFSEMEAWARWSGVTLKAWERGAVLAMDAAYREEIASKSGQGGDEERGPPLTAEIFDAVFAGG